MLLCNDETRKNRDARFTSSWAPIKFRPIHNARVVAALACCFMQSAELGLRFVNGRTRGSAKVADRALETLAVGVLPYPTNAQ